MGGLSSERASLESEDVGALSVEPCEAVIQPEWGVRVQGDEGGLNPAVVGQ